MSTKTGKVLETTNLAQQESELSLLSMVMNADLVSQIILGILIFLSILCWAVILRNYFKYKHLKIFSKKFERMFWSGQLLSDIYIRIKKNNKNPMARIFVSAMDEWEACNKEYQNSDLTKVANNIQDRINKSINVVKNRSINKIESGINTLSIISSASPFIGLLGTVWGIMNSFKAVAQSDNTSLAVVAPGISEALLATAVGLFAAIPAVIAYNYFVNFVDRYISELDDFSDEFTSLLFRELYKNKS